jgi:hypothetical protein
LPDGEQQFAILLFGSKVWWLHDSFLAVAKPDSGMLAMGSADPSVAKLGYRNFTPVEAKTITGSPCHIAKNSLQLGQI